MKAKEAFESRVADETLGFQDALISRGPAGQVAYGLFRAQKRSTRAKSYRGKNRRNSYDKKNDALKFLDVALGLWSIDAGASDWGWKKDPGQSFHNWVLYVDLDHVGQCSFHAQSSLSDKRYAGDWDNSQASIDVVCAYCDRVMEIEGAAIEDDALMPFGTYSGMRLGDLDEGFRTWINGWDGLTNWPSLSAYFKQCPRGGMVPATSRRRACHEE